MSKSNSTLEFRPHLDGLRTVAVALVFVFHATPNALKGGFIGVDVFFVLSGFLITSILLIRREAGTYSLLGFYGRRVRRLLPPVILLVAAVAIYAAVFGSFLARESRFAEIRATLLYFANWNLILTNDDYFTEGLALSSLRHMWSLAIEEQFYLVWPILLGFLAKLFNKTKELFWVIVALSANSIFMLMILYSPLNASRAYYGTDSRVFQPLLGAALAVLLYDKTVKAKLAQSRHIVNVLAMVSFVLILVLSYFVDGTGRFYYFGGAVLVALLTVVVILDGELNPRSLITRILSIPLMVKVGAISYGVYLWHWPMIQWIRVPENADFLEARLVNLFQLMATLGMAGGSYFLMEDPIRKSRVQWKKAFVIAAIASLSVGLGAYQLLKAPEVTAAPVLQQTTSSQTGQEVQGDTSDPSATEANTESKAESQQQESAQDKAEPGNTEAISSDGESVEELTETGLPFLSKQEAEALMASATADRSYRPCKENPKPCVKVQGSEESPTIVLVGDSTAQMYDLALVDLAERYDFTYVHAAVGGCSIGHRLLATGIDGELHKPSNQMCYEQIPLIYDQILREYDPDLILATSSNEPFPHIEDGQKIETGTDQHLKTTRTQLEAAIEKLTSQGALWAFIDVLPGGTSVTCLETDQPNVGRCLRPVLPDSREKPYNVMFSELVEQYPQVIGKVSFIEKFCPNDFCPLIVDSIVVRYDGGHFTGTQAKALADPLAQQLSAIGFELDPTKR